MTTVRACLHDAVQRLRATSDTPQLDAEWLLAGVTAWDRAQLRIRADDELAEATRALFEQWVGRRAQGEPVAYILGEWEFWSLTLSVTPQVLVPRPETEQLVAWALHALTPKFAGVVLDLGTGSGALALAIAAERPHARVFAGDSSPASVFVARRNCASLGLDNVRCFVGDWARPIADVSVDAVLANPPYVASEEMARAGPELGFEPKEALVAAQQGVAAIERVASDARRVLRPGGALAVEHGHRQGTEVRALFDGAGLDAVQSLEDLNGDERITVGWQGGGGDGR